MRCRGTPGTASGINNAVSRLAGLLAVAIFGFVMLHVFSRGPASGLAAISIPKSLRATVLARKSDLAAITLPSERSEAATQEIRQVIAESFVSGFRVLMLLGAVLTAAAGLVARRMIGADRDGSLAARAGRGTRPGFGSGEPGPVSCAVACGPHFAG